MIDNTQINEIQVRYKHTVKRVPNSSIIKSIGLLLQRIIEDAQRLKDSEMKIQMLVRMKKLDSDESLYQKVTTN